MLPEEQCCRLFFVYYIHTDDLRVVVPCAVCTSTLVTLDCHFTQQGTEVTTIYKDSYLNLNVDKTRWMVIYLKNNGNVSELIIEGVTVERVN